MPRPLRIGVQLPEVERDVRWPEYDAIARAAEEVGFDSIWVGDHLLYREERPARARPVGRVGDAGGAGRLDARGCTSGRSWPAPGSTRRA